MAGSFLDCLLHTIKAPGRSQPGDAAPAHAPKRCYGFNPFAGLGRLPGFFIHTVEYQHLKIEQQSSGRGAERVRRVDERERGKADVSLSL